MVPIYYNDSYICSGFSFDTTRKAAWVAESLEREPLDGIEIQSPTSLSAEQVSSVHDAAYVRAIETGEPRSLAESQGFGWDPGLWEMVLASNGGAVAAAKAAIESGTAGSLSSGLHHARRDQGSGFCTFNGLVLAAKAVLDEGAESVLILDLDAHCGGGTHSLIRDGAHIWQLDVSVDRFDHYEPSERTTLRMVRSSDEYLPTIERELDELAQSAPPFSLCIYNAGMDPFEGSGIGGLSGINQKILADRERTVFKWCRARRIPIAFVLAGGYVGPSLPEDKLVRLHRLTIRAAC